MKRLLCAVGLVLLLALGAQLRAFPKPSINRIAWELDFEHGTPTRIMVTVPGQQAPKAYWYMTFKVTNNTNEEQEFLPIFEMVDDKANIHRSDKAIPPAVFEAIKLRERNKFLQPLGQATGRLLVGADQAKDSVAIWAEPVERMGTFQIFVTGLSGEAIWFKDGKELPMQKADWIKIKADQAGEILRKTLELLYHVPGDEVYQGRDLVHLKKEHWVMR